MESKNQQQNEVTLYLYPDQVSGKEPKLTTSDRSQILKGYNSIEHQFYQTINQQHSSLALRNLSPFTPKFFGKLQLSLAPHLQIGEEGNKDWLSHLASRYKTRNQSNSFTILQNLTDLYKTPCIFDIKIGGRNLEGKTHKITESVSKYFIKLNGCKIYDPQHSKSLLFSKYFLQEITQFEQMCKYLGLYFAHDNQLRIDTIRAIYQRLKLLSLAFKEVRGYRFISTSLCLIYDSSNPKTSDVRLIDFGRVIAEHPQFQDTESIQGCQNVLSLLQQLLFRKQFYQNFISILRQKSTEEEIAHIPERKRIKQKEKNVAAEE